LKLGWVVGFERRRRGEGEKGRAEKWRRIKVDE
jgi:hypothetical protein